MTEYNDDDIVLFLRWYWITFVNGSSYSAATIVSAIRRRCSRLPR